MRVRERKDRDGCAQCLKYLLVTLNVVFFCCACAIIGVGIWILKERNFTSVVLGSTLLTAAIIMCIAGSIFLIIVTSIFGCCGVIKENKCMLVTYFILLLFVMCCLVIAGILAVVFRTQIGEEVTSYMEDTLKEDYGINLDYAYNRLVTNAWDETQRRLECCAVDVRGWEAYRQSDWFKEHASTGPDGTIIYVPASCCKGDSAEILRQCQSNTDGPPVTNYHIQNSALHYQGCYQECQHWAWEHSRYFMGIGLGIGLTLIFCMILTICMYRIISSEDYYYTTE